MSGVAHSGRGGAGNVQPKSPNLLPEDLSTPHLKQPTYSTGRGGSGNMAKNDPEHPELARAAQDVGPPPAAGKTDTSAFHTGRGGAANVMNEGEPRRSGSKERPGNLVEKGKEMLGLKK